MDIELEIQKDIAEDIEELEKRYQEEMELYENIGIKFLNYQEDTIDK